MVARVKGPTDHVVVVGAGLAFFWLVVVSCIVFFC
jgi:hypothetical protein